MSMHTKPHFYSVDAFFHWSVVNRIKDGVIDLPVLWEGAKNVVMSTVSGFSGTRSVTCAAEASPRRSSVILAVAGCPMTEMKMLWVMREQAAFFS